MVSDENVSRLQAAANDARVPMFSVYQNSHHGSLRWRMREALAAMVRVVWPLRNPSWEELGNAISESRGSIFDQVEFERAIRKVKVAQSNQRAKIVSTGDGIITNRRTR